MLKEQLKRHEGFREKPYKCTAGKLTIGYGRNLDDKGISRAEAEVMLDNDIEQVTRELSEALPWLDTLNQARRDVLLNMAYNLGVDGLLRWRFTLGDIEHGAYVSAARRMRNSLWATQVGDRAKELANQLEKGEYHEKDS